MAFKDFALLEVLASADVDTYLMSQAVIRCTSTTRPASPVDGMRIFETDTGREMHYRPSTWGFYRGVDPFVRKTADETYNSNVSHNDTELVVNSEANATYLVAAMVITNSPTAADINLALFATPGTALWSPFAPHSGDASNTNIDQAKVSINKLPSGGGGDITGYGADVIHILRGILITTGSAGTFRLAWRQVTANAGPTIVRADSSLSLKRVA